MGPRTLRKCTWKILPCPPKRRMPSKTSSPLSYRVPTQKVMPFCGLGTSSNSRWKSAKRHRICGTPQ